MIYLLNIHVYWSKFNKIIIRLIIIDGLKDPKEYCIQKFYPQMRDYLSDFDDAKSFFFS